MGDFKRLAVWNKAHRLVLDIYRASVSFPQEERYGLTAQVRRAAISIPANIAEGCGRSGDRELGRFLRIALGSATEIEYHILLAKDLELLEDDLADSLAEASMEIQRMLAVLLRYLESTRTKDQRLKTKD